MLYIEFFKKGRDLKSHSHGVKTPGPNITLCDKYIEYRSVCLIRAKTLTICVVNCPEIENPGTKNSGVILFASGHLFPGQGNVLNVTGI